MKKINLGTPDAGTTVDQVAELAVEILRMFSFDQPILTFTFNGVRVDCYGTDTVDLIVQRCFYLSRRNHNHSEEE